MGFFITASLEIPRVLPLGSLGMVTAELSFAAERVFFRGSYNVKFISFKNIQNEERAGLMVGDKIVDLEDAARELGLDMPSSMNEILQGLPATLKTAGEIENAFKKRTVRPVPDQMDCKVLAPVPHPASCRDAYAFRQHVEAARKNRGLPMIPEFDEFPVFYFTNHNAIIGSGDLVVQSDHLEQLDFELEVAAVIGKQGRNIRAQEADGYILGFTIMNDFSARALQTNEMKLNLGPAKGKDFATAIGPYLVTKDELCPHLIKTAKGEKYKLDMKATHNGKLVSQGNMQDMHFTFAEIIERISYGVDIFPGDIIGSGTVGTGCFLELNGTGGREAKEKGKSFSPTWLKVGDVIELEVTGLGKLVNRIIKAECEYSLVLKC